MKRDRLVMTENGTEPSAVQLANYNFCHFSYFAVDFAQIKMIYNLEDN
jgi:hypothetical protein